jgi:TPR repeat protein
MHNANSSSYRGQWHNGAQSGYGFQINASGLTYEGTWVANKREGFGQEQRPDGREYVGEWLADNRHGQGRESSVDGAYHDGAWENNQTLGPGTRRDRMGMEISGVWNDNHVSSGLLMLPTGAEYAGPLLRKNGSEVQPPLLEWLEENAAANDPYAQLFLAKAYADYKRPLPDPAKALRWFSAAADAGIADAQYRLATLIIDGRWVPANSQMAMRYLETASNGGNLAARNNLAWILATDPDPANRDGAKALAVIKPIALLYRDWQHLDTLAAAYAEHGEFEAASQAQRSAVEAIAADYAPEGTTQDTAELLQEMRSRLILYENGQPYREDAARSARGGQTP